MKNKTITKELSTDSLEIGSPENESRLPRDWNLARFDEVAYATDFVANGSFASLRENVRYKSEPDYAILVRLTDYTKRWRGDYVYVDKDAYDFLRKSSVEPGDIIIANVGDPGRVFRVPNLGRPMTLGPNSVLVRPKEGLEKAFLQYFFMSSWGQQLIAKITTGTAQKKFNKTSLRALRIPIAPLDQQNRVVAEIEKQFSRLDEAVGNLKRVKANLKRYKAAVLKAAVEGKLTEEWRKAHPDVEPASELLKRILAERRAKWKGKREYREPDTSGLADVKPLPEAWMWTTLGQLAVVGSGNTPATILDHLRTDGSIPWYKVGDMNRPENQRVMKSAEAYLSIDSVEKLRITLFPPGTIIFPKRGGAIATNKKRQLQIASTTDLNIMGLTPQAEVLAYFWWWFSAINLASLSDGSNVPQLNNKDVLPLPVPLPPVAEQKQIVAEVEKRFSVIEELETQVVANLQRAERFRQSILQRAFEGKLVNLGMDGMSHCPQVLLEKFVNYGKEI